MTRSNNSRGLPLGLTLLEVVAGLALMATLLVSLLVAFSRHAEQVRSAQQTLDAVEAADRLIAQWFGPEGTVPRRATGRTGTNLEWSWQTREVHQREAARLGGQIVRLEVYSPGEGRERKLVTVDLVVAGERSMPRAPAGEF